MSDILHSRSKGRRLVKLKKVLACWTEINVEYCQAHPEDSPWSYNERATLSTLAGAAWRMNWFALEEFGTEKHCGERDATTGKKLKTYGRCDLYLSDGPTSFVVEAKQAWQRIGTRVRKENSYVGPLMKRAFDDAGVVPKVEGDKRIALTFVVPSFPASLLTGTRERERFHQATAIVNQWLETVRNIPNADAVAWSFPKVARTLANANGHRIFPGVVALVQERLRATRVGKSVGGAKS